MRQVLEKYYHSQEDMARILRFFVVGGINTLFGYSLYAILIYLNLFYALASMLSTIGGVLFNFKTTGIIVFKSRDNRLLLRFMGVYAFNYIWGVAILSIFYSYNVNMYLAGASLIIPGALVAYVLQKKFVFGRETRNANKRNNALL